jgi:hypothetical protein
LASKGHRPVGRLPTIWNTKSSGSTANDPKVQLQRRDFLLQHQVGSWDRLFAEVTFDVMVRVTYVPEAIDLTANQEAPRT